MNMFKNDFLSLFKSDKDKRDVEAMQNNEIRENTSACITEEEEDFSSVVKNKLVEIDKLDKLIISCKEKADKSKNSANEAKEKSAKLFHHKAAIEYLQNAVIDISDSQVSQAEAQQLSFEFQKKLAEISQFLFELGVSNLAANRTVVRELELKLKGASEEELNDLAYKELMNVIKQLKAQEDIMNKQAELTKKVNKNQKNIKKQESINYEQEIKISNQAEKDLEHDKLIAENTYKNLQQDYKLDKQTKKNLEHDRQIAQNIKKNIQQDFEICRQAKKDSEHDDRINDLVKQVNDLKNIIGKINNTKANKKPLVFCYIISIITLCVAITELLIIII